ncbi:hypothetical protein PMAYCL1PPCAC_03340, partial [Pristionchus mayeri]
GCSLDTLSRCVHLRGHHLQHDSNEPALLALSLVLGHCLLGVLDSWFHRAVGCDHLFALRRTRQSSHRDRRYLHRIDRQADGRYAVRRLVRALDLDGDGRVHRVDQHEVLPTARLQELSLLQVDAEFLVLFFDLVGLYVGHLRYAPQCTYLAPDALGAGVTGGLDLVHFALPFINLACFTLLVL